MFTAHKKWIEQVPLLYFFIWWFSMFLCIYKAGARWLASLKRCCFRCEAFRDSAAVSHERLQQCSLGHVRLDGLQWASHSY